MPLRSFLSTVAVTFLAIGFLGCGYGKSFVVGETTISNETFISRCGDKEIHFLIIDKDVPGFPSWQPGASIPLSVDQAISVASKELPKYSKNMPGWELHGVSLTPLRPRNAKKDKWIYLVQYERVNTSGLLEIPVALNGAAIAGEEHPLDKKRWTN